MTELTAYLVSPKSMDLVPAARRRPWMDGSNKHFANRCLPLVLANQSGWFVESRHTVEVRWDGGVGPSAVTVKVLEGDPPCPAIAHFGVGVLTWQTPWLFRTSPGWNLLVRGPPNFPVDGLCPLDGLVETDWAAATFTMNWKFTRPGHTVMFHKGDPLAMIVPHRRGDLEQVVPRECDINEDPEFAARYNEWTADRGGFLLRLAARDPETVKQGWQKDYFLGTDSPGKEHQMNRKLRRFDEVTG